MVAKAKTKTTKGNRSQRARRTYSAVSMTKKEWREVLWGGVLPDDQREAYDQLRAFVSDSDEPPVDNADYLGVIIALANGERQP